MMTTLEGTDGKEDHSERLILIILAAVQFTSIVDFMVVMPLGPQLMRSLAIGPAQFGLVVSSYTFAAAAAGLIASSIVDRFARRTSFVTMFAGFLLGTLCCALAPSYRFLLAARVTTGAFGGILGGMSMAIIGDVFPEDRRGRATSSLTSAFAVATVAGVPIGLYLGTKYGWHIPFIILVLIGVPILFLALIALPRLDGHLGASHVPPLRLLVDTFVNRNHYPAFALLTSVMIGGFSVIPYISAYLVTNVGMRETELPLVYLVAGGLTLVAAPWIGRFADRHGKLLAYRAIAPISAVMLLTITHLPAVRTFIAVGAVAILMVSNAGRMIAAMAMITSSVQRHRRGGFMSANSSVQHLSAGVGAYIGGLIIVQSSDGRLLHFGLVGWIAAATTLASLWFAGNVRIVDDEPVAQAISLAAAAEATCDTGEPMMGA